MKQTDRIKAIFEDRGDQINFTPIERTIHEGFVDNTLRLCIFTDHQLFDRFHKYNLKSDKARSGKSSTVLKRTESVYSRRLCGAYRSWYRTFFRFGAYTEW